MASTKDARKSTRANAEKGSTAPEMERWAAPPPTGLVRYLPIASWLPQYEWSKWLVVDFLAGMTVWGLIVPEAMGYASIAGMPLQAGLYTLVGTLVVYSLLGTSRQLVIAATAAASSITASVVAGLNPAGAGEYASMLGVVVLAVGLLFVLAGLLRLGFIADFIPRPVMAGFVFGLGLFIMTKQAYKVLGLPKPSGSTVEMLASDIGNLGHISWTTAAMGLGAIVVLLLFERLLPRLPGALIVLLGAIGLSAFLDLDDHGVEIVGEVPGGLPDFALPSLSGSDVPVLVAGAVGVMLVIMTESLGGADNFAQKHHYRVDTNQELIAQGFTNLTSGVLGGLANGASLSSSSVNDNAGARTSLSLAVAWVLVILTLLFLTPLFTNLPEAVLGAIVIVAVKGLIKVDEFKRFWRAYRNEFWLGTLTLVTVVAWDVLPAMVLGVVLAILMITYRASRASVAVLARNPDAPEVWRDSANHPDFETVNEILVLRLNAQLFYANAESFVDEAKRLIGKARPRGVVLDAEATRVLDITGGEFLGRLVDDVQNEGIPFALAGLDAAVIEFAHRSGLLEQIGRENIYSTITQAVEAVRGSPFEERKRDPIG